jgi:hypothetical protein
MRRFWMVFTCSFFMMLNGAGLALDVLPPLPNSEILAGIFRFNAHSFSDTPTSPLCQRFVQFLDPTHGVDSFIPDDQPVSSTKST